MEEDIQSPDEDPEAEDTSDEEADPDVSAATKLRNEMNSVSANVGDFPPEGVWRNVKLGTLHRAPKKHGGATACGFVMSSAECQVLKEWPKGPLRLCKRPRCFPK